MIAKSCAAPIGCRNGAGSDKGVAPLLGPVSITGQAADQVRHEPMPQPEPPGEWRSLRIISFSDYAIEERWPFAQLTDLIGNDEVLR
jgi:hypothetical protein